MVFHLSKYEGACAAKKITHSASLPNCKCSQD
jgi:hypothetical protein